MYVFVCVCVCVALANVHVRKTEKETETHQVCGEKKKRESVREIVQQTMAFHGTRKNFSKVSALLDLLCNVTQELVFEKFCGSNKEWPLKAVAKISQKAACC